MYGRDRWDCRFWRKNNMVKIFLLGMVAMLGVAFVLFALYMFWVVIIEDGGEDL